MLVVGLDDGVYRGNVGFKVSEVLPEVICFGSHVDYWLYSLHWLLVHLCHNLKVWDFCGIVIDIMIHLGRFFIPPGLLNNVGHVVIIDVLYGKYSVLCNEVPGISIVFINNKYIWPCLHPSLFIGSLQEFFCWRGLLLWILRQKFTGSVMLLIWIAWYQFLMCNRWRCWCWPSLG